MNQTPMFNKPLLIVSLLLVLFYILVVLVVVLFAQGDIVTDKFCKNKNYYIEVTSYEKDGSKKAPYFPPNKKYYRVSLAIWLYSPQGKPFNYIRLFRAFKKKSYLRPDIFVKRVRFWE